MDCLDNVIGLSRTECECLDLPSDSDASEFSVSESGVFLDELDGFNINVVNGGNNCSKGGLWDRMYRAVENAKQDFITNVLSGLNQRFKPRAEIFSGQLGSADYKANQPMAYSYCGINIKPLQLKGGYIRLKRIGVIVNAAVTVTANVYKSVNRVGTLLGSFTSPSPVSAGQITWLDLAGDALELPMYDYGGRVEYYVVLEVNGFLPKNNVRDCGCGGIKRPYLQWLDFFGTRGNDPTDFNTFNQTRELNGVALDVDIRCKTSEIICSSERPMDYEDDGQSRDIAYAIRFRAAAKLYADLIASEQINRFTLLNREYMEAKILEWNTEYSKWVEWFYNNVSVDQNDCLVCRESSKMKKTGLLV